MDKFRIWFMPTGWRPKDVNQKYPVESIDSPQDYEKILSKIIHESSNMVLDTIFYNILFYDVFINIYIL